MFQADELLLALREAHVRFVVIGGIAVGVHGYVRATKDLDIVPDPEPENVTRLSSLLRELDAEHVGVGDFAAEEFPYDPIDPEQLALGANFRLETRLGPLDIMQWVAGIDESASLTHQPLLLALAYVGFFLNLFNLIPMSPLDGGRILGAASRWAYVAGLPILAVVAIWHFNPFLLIILVLGVMDAYQRFRGGAVNALYYSSISPLARWAVAGGYVLLAGLLAIAMSDTHNAMQLLRSGGLVG